MSIVVACNHLKRHYESSAEVCVDTVYFLVIIELYQDRGRKDRFTRMKSWFIVSVKVLQTLFN